MPLRRLWPVSTGFLLAASVFAGCGSDETNTTTSSSSGSGGAGGAFDVDAYLQAPPSCAYECPNDTCAEANSPYACPALGAWDKIPHLETCESWDTTYPTPVQGKCSATAPTGDALKQPGPDAADPGSRNLPDGRANKPAGKEWIFDEPNQNAGLTAALVTVPGTPFVLTVDIGPKDQAIHAVNVDQIGFGNPVTGYVPFTNKVELNGAIAFVAPNRAYVPTANGIVQALTFDTQTGALDRDDPASLTLPPTDADPFFAAGVAATPDGKTLVVSGVFDTRVLVFDIDPASATYQQQIGELETGEREGYGVYFDPNDPSGTLAYVSVRGGRKVLEVDLSNPAMPVLSRSFATDKNPQGVAFLDSRWMVVANDFGETISLVDRVSGTVTPVPVDFEPGLKGLDVSSLSYDDQNKRLIVTLAGINALAVYDVDLSQPVPTLTPAGRLPTSWWPSGVVAHPDGSLTVTNLRGGPIGVFDEPNTIGGGDGKQKMRGSVAHIQSPTLADLSAGDMTVHKQVAVGERPGYPTIDCPAGASDFPVPATNTEGPSPLIKHIFFIVRENKTFDALLGDMPGVEGDPKLTMKDTTADMDRVWTNFRELGRDFVIGDNFYNLAVKSTQGHHWTTYGRATDFCERTWGSNARAVPICGVADVGRAEEGSLFEWLQANDVRYTILGEVVGNPLKAPTDYSPIDIRYPGGPFQNIPYNDLEKACYTAGRLRVACDLGSFVYMTLPNDHTLGVSPKNPTPETMCSVNDTATGMFVDALSHSPLWASSLVVITEDDPQQGGDHIDYHRTPLVVVSPWVKRGYVSKTHIDVASLYKLFAHVLGLPYNNLLVKNAGLPLDMFTSTPDYTPYTYTPRQWPLACGMAATPYEVELTESWDFKDVDSQPGLGDQVMRWMQGKQLTEMPSELRTAIDARKARRANGLPPEHDDDDDD